eukprot:TRINITY_DN13480_c0_g1_i1.p1 TRINITY_DN13480_c0_g1~~TRINITY_DN13480_c0_g1_i1.p1  ORF type:complete len:150 (+),score=20.97 TRINITY_DN13480_c0_g1_i1:90-539(+)
MCIRDRRSTPRAGFTFSDFLMDTIRDWLPSWANQTGDPGSRLSRIFAYFEQLHTLGVSLQGQPHQSFVDVYRNEVFVNASASPHHSMRPHDPMVMMGLATAAAAYARDDSVLFFQVITSAPGDTDTVANQIGMAMGAFYGYEHIAGVLP